MIILVTMEIYYQILRFNHYQKIEYNTYKDSISQ